ncbi:MAG: helicase RepA family protein [Nevskiaceae bacterium]|jgi:hypothetical protein|nr:helicase RepA family protein [Nevskiaceae bacterium]
MNTAADNLLKGSREAPIDEPKPSPRRNSLLADLSADPALIDTAEPPAFVVHSLLPVGGANLAAPGGTGKTTTVLNEFVHVVCGDLYGHEVILQGPCVLVTAEDGVGIYRYVLQRILADGQDCGQLPQQAAARAKPGIKLLTWSRSKFGALVVLDQSGDMRTTTGWDDLLSVLTGMNPRPVYVSLDPAVLFGAGERHGNDGDAFLASMIHEAGLALGCCFQLVDHVSQNVARTGIVDQYAARGGTAKTDNMRLARQLVRVTGEVEGLPLGVMPQDVEQGRVLQLHTTKKNFGPPVPMKWLRRRGHWIEHLRGASADEVAAQRRRDVENAGVDDAGQFAAAVKAARERGEFPTVRRLTEEVGILDAEGKRMRRERARNAATNAQFLGLVRLTDLPAGHPDRKGARAQYLESIAPNAKPAAERPHD